MPDVDAAESPRTSPAERTPESVHPAEGPKPARHYEEPKPARNYEEPKPTGQTGQTGQPCTGEAVSGVEDSGAAGVGEFVLEVSDAEYDAFMSAIKGVPFRDGRELKTASCTPEDRTCSWLDVTGRPWQPSLRAAGLDQNPGGSDCGSGPGYWTDGTRTVSWAQLLLGYGPLIEGHPVSP
jgi:hypothetical protein